MIDVPNSKLCELYEPTCDCEKKCILFSHFIYTSGKYNKLMILGKNIYGLFGMTNYFWIYIVANFGHNKILLIYYIVLAWRKFIILFILTEKKEYIFSEMLKKVFFGRNISIFQFIVYVRRYANVENENCNENVH